MRRGAGLLGLLVLFTVAACGSSSTFSSGSTDAGVDSGTGGGSAGSSTGGSAGSSTGGSGGSATGGSAGSSMGGSGGSATGGTGGGGATGGSGGSGGSCNPGCTLGLTCCNGHCVNLANDVNNCGQCGNTCSGSTPFCAGTHCTPAPCVGSTSCSGGEMCCGTSCCGQGELCCAVQKGGPSTGPTCETPVNGTCPVGCPTCL